MSEPSLAGLPAEVHDQLVHFLRVVDRDLPGLVVGCYAVGSLALGDFSRRVSNIDVVAVSGEAWDADQLRAARRATRLLHRRGRDGVVAYVSVADLAHDRTRLGTSPAMSTGQALLNPFTRDLLVGAPVMRGPARPAVAQSDGGLETWATDLLVRRWSPWARAAHQRPGAKWMKRSLANPVLDVCRLYGASKGHVLSKAQAAEMVLSEIPTASSSRRVLQEALSWRGGTTTSNYWGPVERKRDAIRLIIDLADAGKATPR